MTIGQLSARAGLSTKAIREFEGRGLIYSAGRSEGNYRLFDEWALWCAQVIVALRGLGLTLREIEQLAGVYLGRPDEPIEGHISQLLDRADARIAERVRELKEVRRRIRAFRKQLAGGELSRLAKADPHRTRRRA
jgi:MerR family transcriptional regulator, copper efflux regulator